MSVEARTRLRKRMATVETGGTAKSCKGEKTQEDTGKTINSYENDKSQWALGTVRAGQGPGAPARARKGRAGAGRAWEAGQGRPGPGRAGKGRPEPKMRCILPRGPARAPNLR